MIGEGTRRTRDRDESFGECQREAVICLSAIVQRGYEGVAVLENDGKNVHDQSLAFDGLCVGPGFPDEGKLAIAVEGIFPVGRDCIAMLEKSPEGGHDWWWEGIKSDEGG